MSSMFMNSENSKTSDPHRPLFNLSNEIILKRVINTMWLYQLLAYSIHGKTNQVAQKQCI